MSTRPATLLQICCGRPLVRSWYLRETFDGRQPLLRWDYVGANYLGVHGRPI